jgi:hypothetical protein
MAEFNSRNGRPFQPIRWKGHPFGRDIPHLRARRPTAAFGFFATAAFPGFIPET